MWQAWLLIAGMFAMLEVFTTGFLVMWFSVGALLAMIVSFFTDSVVAQMVVFIISSTLLLFETKPFITRITKKDVVVKTNAYSIEGKVGRVIKDIEPAQGSGQIKVNGEVWSAKSYNDTYIPKDTEVIIEKIDGVKAIIKPLV